MPSLLASESLPRPYFLNEGDKSKIPTLSQDAILEDETLASTSTSEPGPLPPKPILDKYGKPLTKRQMLEVSDHRGIIQLAKILTLRLSLIFAIQSSIINHLLFSSRKSLPSLDTLSCLLPMMQNELGSIERQKP
jgi:hypothetical protein